MQNESSLSYQKVWKKISILIVISVVMENIKLFDVLGAAFKLTHVVMLFSILFAVFTQQVKRKHLLLGALYLLLPIFPLYRIVEVKEWIKSYVIYVIIVAFFAFAFRFFCIEIRTHCKYYVRLIIYTIAFSQILGIVQFICMNWFGYFFLQDAFGSFQFHKSSFDVQHGFYRAYSVFHEPSVFAWVSLFSLALILYTGKTVLSKRNYILYAGLDVIAIFCSLSTSGIALMLVMIVLYVIVKTRSWAKAIGSVIGCMVAFLFLWMFTDLLQPLERIFYELVTENTSGYERIVTPILYAVKTFEYYPVFGRGIGQMGMVDKVGIIGRYEAVHNALFGVVIDFGLTSLMFFIPVFTYSVKRIKRESKWILMLFSMCSIYLTTGAYISMDTFVFLILCIAIAGNEKYRFAYL